jgi:hypothetical protein
MGTFLEMKCKKKFLLLFLLPFCFLNFNYLMETTTTQQTASSTTSSYQFLGKLKGHSKSVNCLDINILQSLLISGSEVFRIDLSSCL